MKNYQGWLRDHRGNRLRRKSQKPYVPKELAEAIKRDAIRWKCSESWVMVSALAAFYDIDIITPFEKKRKKNAA